MRFDNWIAGEWVGSDARIENINPSDTRDVIGLYAQANFDERAHCMCCGSTYCPM